MMQDGICTQIKLINFKMEHVYKNLFEEDGEYFFIMNDGRKKQVVEQQGVLMAYLIELMKEVVPNRLDNE